MSTQNPAPTCGGCEGKGAHSRACRSPIHTIADLVDNLGDTLSNHPNQANTAWNLAAQLRAIAAPAGVVDREAVALLIHHGRHVCRDCPGIPSINDVATAQAILDLLPTRTVAQVKGEAWDEAVTEACCESCGCLRAKNVPNPYRADELERRNGR